MNPPLFDFGVVDDSDPPPPCCDDAFDRGENVALWLCLLFSFSLSSLFSLMVSYDDLVDDNNDDDDEPPPPPILLLLLLLLKLFTDDLLLLLGLLLSLNELVAFRARRNALCTNELTSSSDINFFPPRSVATSKLRACDDLL
jgi:hypothetical protein